MEHNYALITGATGVIGRRFAIEYAKRGYNLFLTGRDGGKLADVKTDIVLTAPDIDIICFPCDLSDGESRDRLYEQIKESGANVTRAALVAGLDDEGPFVGFSKELIRRMIRVNAEAAIETTSELIKTRGADELKVVVISSLAAYFRMPLMALYSASKRMLYHFFLALKEELKGTGISATLVLPGAVPTRPDIIERINAQGFFGRISSMPPDKLAKKSVCKSEKGRAVYVPNLFNKFLRTLSFIVPARLVSKAAGRKWRKAAKKKGNRE